MFELRCPGGRGGTGALACPKGTHSAKYCPARHMSVPITLHEKNAPSRFENFKPQRLSTRDQRPTNPFRNFRFKNSGQILEHNSCEGKLTPLVCSWGFISITNPFTMPFLATPRFAAAALKPTRAAHFCTRYLLFTVLDRNPSTGKA